MHYPIGYAALFDHGGPTLPNLSGTSLDYVLGQPQAGQGYYSQPDGRGNIIDGHGPGFSVVVTTPHGTVTFAPGASGDGDVGLKGWGDFLGSGHTDLLLETYGGRYQYQTFIVQADGPPGTYDPALVGVHVPNPTARRGHLLYDPEVVGDQNGDGTPDIAFGSYVYESRQLATLPPGAKLPAPILTIPSRYVPLLAGGNLLNIDPNAPPSFLAVDTKTNSVRVFDAHSDQLVLRSPSKDGVPVAVAGDATGLLVNGHHIVDYEATSGRDLFFWRWDLDAPCGK
ncbi:MAG: hypothetical protein ACLPVY_18920 [Acidimicrobiia bacterium]